MRRESGGDTRGSYWDNSESPTPRVSVPERDCETRLWTVPSDSANRDRKREKYRDKQRVGAQVVKTIERLQFGGVEYALNNASLQQSWGIDRLCRLMASNASTASHSHINYTTVNWQIAIGSQWKAVDMPSLAQHRYSQLTNQTKALHSNTRTELSADKSIGNNFWNPIIFVQIVFQKFFWYTFGTQRAFQALQTFEFAINFPNKLL